MIGIMHENKNLNETIHNKHGAEKRGYLLKL